MVNNLYYATPTHDVMVACVQARTGIPSEIVAGLFLF